MEDTKKSQFTLEEAGDRIEEVEKRVTLLEDGLRTTVEAIMPKLDALQTARNREDVAAPAAAAPADTPGAAACAPATLLEAAQRGDAQTLLQLLAAGADPLQRDPRGHSALHLAADGGHPAATAALVGHGAVVDAPGPRRRSPLHCAALRGHVYVATILLGAGAEKDAEDVDGHTPLALAIKGGHERTVALLLDRGASFNSVTKFPPNSTSIPMYVKLVPELCSDKGGAKGDSLALAAEAQQWGVVRMLLLGGQRVHEGTRALAWAARAAEVDVVKELLRRGAAPSDVPLFWGLRYAASAAVVWAFVEATPSLVDGHVGRFALLLAATNGQREALEALLAAGVGVDGRDALGSSALEFSAAHGHIACVNVLIEHGAKVDSVDGNGNTPLHSASRYGAVECVRALLAAGASATKANKDNKTPIDVAESDDVRNIITEHSGCDAEKCVEGESGPKK